MLIRLDTVVKAGLALAAIVAAAPLNSSTGHTTPLATAHTTSTLAVSHSSQSSPANSSTHVVGTPLSSATQPNHTVPTTTPSRASSPATHNTSVSTTSVLLVNGSYSVYNKFQATATPTPTSSLPLAPTGALPSGYIQTSGDNFVLNGKPITLRGCNLGGWLVIEDWEDGIADDTDDSGDHPFRQSYQTLANRFGAANATTLVNTWYNNFVDAQDFANMAALDFNLVRIPFAWTTLQNPDGSWRSDAFTLLDWAVQQAAKNGLYVVLSFHVWEGQFADYDTISTDTPQGRQQRIWAQQVWEKIAQHYLNNPTIAFFDVINEPVGSYANYLQRNLYSAVRNVDPNRIVLLEAYTGTPADYNFNQVAYSFHEYKMEGSNYTYNQEVWAQNKTLIQEFQQYAPFYMGEFMASGQTLTYLLSQMNSINVAWSMWTFKAVDEGGWAFYNYPHYPVTFRVNINTDSYAHILGVWQNLSSTTATANQALISAYQGYGV